MSTDPKTYWNGPVGERWTSLAHVLEKVFGPLREAALDLAAARPGEHVLDVGCGCGGTTLTLAKAVGKAGHVLGVDISAPMLARAKERIEAAGVAAAVELDDAATTRFDPTFDLLHSAFGTMFFPDPHAAFRNLATALKPGGRVAFICWRALAENAGMSAPLAAAKPFLPPMEPPVPGAPGPFAFADPDRLKRILEGAGFTDVVISPLDRNISLGDTLDEAVEFSLETGPTSHALRAAPEVPREPVAAAVREALRPYASAADGVSVPTATWLVSAKR
ncbi:Methyltransferase [Labilithrix luteola]|uniref:Methyltransferase n=1 Tax=Labilithrix luteola TaxID=1391654 RepID=A0A0K1QBB5_9BACT|nr:methyltransferase domain-containing protein [Labilithrix luteola]AKV02962.1 Methyltransferase [Labilithrix luteola]